MFNSLQTFTINGDDNKVLEKVLQCAFEICGESVESFYEDKNGLVFCSHCYGDSTKYPFKATIPILVEQINQYINNLSNEDILRLAGKEPYSDGTVELGWEIFYPLWYGENEIERYEDEAILAVRPHWIVYGK